MTLEILCKRNIKNIFFLLSYVFRNYSNYLKYIYLFASWKQIINYPVPVKVISYIDPSKFSHF